MFDWHLDRITELDQDGEVTDTPALDADGVWIRRLTIPEGPTVLDAGPDWVLLGQRGEMDVPTVAVYGVVERGEG